MGSLGLQLPSGYIHLLQPGLLHRLQVTIRSTVDHHGLQGENLLHHGLHHRLQGNLWCLEHLFPLLLD